MDTVGRWRVLWEVVGTVKRRGLIQGVVGTVWGKRVL